MHNSFVPIHNKIYINWYKQNDTVYYIRFCSISSNDFFYWYKKKFVLYILFLNIYSLKWWKIGSQSHNKLQFEWLCPQDPKYFSQSSARQSRKIYFWNETVQSRAERQIQWKTTFLHSLISLQRASDVNDYHNIVKVSYMAFLTN